MNGKLDDLIREGKDTDALRLLARVQYEKGKIGQTRMLLMIRVADDLDDALREKLEREKGCEFCRGSVPSECGEKGYFFNAGYYVYGNGTPHYVKVLFCPKCGRRLTKEEQEK